MIVSYSLISKILPSLRARKYDVLVADEAQALKSIDAVRTKAVYGRDGLIKCTRRVWLLSGTIYAKSPRRRLDALPFSASGQAKLQRVHSALLPVKPALYGGGWQVTGANLEHAAELADFYRPHVLRRTLKDVALELPALVFNAIPVDPEMYQRRRRSRRKKRRSSAAWSRRSAEHHRTNAHVDAAAPDWAVEGTDDY